MTDPRNGRAPRRPRMSRCRGPAALALASVIAVACVGRPRDSQPPTPTAAAMPAAPQPGQFPPWPAPQTSADEPPEAPPDTF